MSADTEEGFPWYVKAMIVLTILVILAIIVIDLFEFPARSDTEYCPCVPLRPPECGRSMRN